MSKVIFEQGHQFAVENRDDEEYAWTRTGYYATESEARREAGSSVWRYARVIDLEATKEGK
ncbi:hypothetical protein [Leucobacter japonicus]|uniref:hypothetical protein n=1 Tax=Leucobacter japonicus TaxID=1461259 RepID=UPI0006A7C8CF|nr:hypothetical protein [Leucobacter japonicus]